MSAFTLQLYDSRQGQRIEGVQCFVGEDASGSFALLAHHARFMTALNFGLARFRDSDENWHYLALPGALLYFADNTLTLFCRRYLIDDDYAQISQRLADELVTEEAQLHEVKESLRRMEEAMLKRLWELGQQGVRLHE